MTHGRFLYGLSKILYRSNHLSVDCRVAGRGCCDCSVLAALQRVRRASTPGRRLCACCNM